MNDPLGSAFDIAPLQNEIKNAITTLDNSDDTTEEDLNFVKNNLKELINKAQDALDEFMAVAKQGESAREYEVVATLIKTIADVNKDFMDHMKKKKDLQVVDMTSLVEEKHNHITLTTDQLNKMLEEMDE